VSLSGVHGILIIQVSARDKVTRLLLSLQDQALLRLVPAHLNRGVKEWLVRDNTSRFEATACRENHPRCRIVDPSR